MPHQARLAVPILRRSPSEVLPRVRAVIEQREIESERLIGWVQLGVVLFFAALYALSPRPLDAMGAAPVATALTLYLIFTAARLALSYVTVLPVWLLVASMLLDVAMLIGLIWSFHLQYGQPAPFSLKVPTFTYIFVFIVLRALRFDARFVLAMGSFAALGWLALTVYAVEVSGPDAITRSFITYLNGNAILIGAEVDKVVAILVVTAILTLVIRRAGVVLAQAVTEEVRTRDMQRFLPRDVADVITSAEQVVGPGDAAERDAAVLMLDLRGFTAFAATLEPREVVAMLVALHKRIVPIIGEHRGVVDKYMGDGLMATFGAVYPSPTAAADAMRSLDRIVAEARLWRASLAVADGRPAPAVNAAVAAGPVVFAALGDEERLEYTIIGESVNLATKLEKHNKVEGSVALTTAPSYRMAVEQGYAPATAPETLAGRRVDGVPEPLDIVVLAR